MRYFVIALAILCGAVSAYAAEPQKWCSDGAQLIPAKDEGWILKVKGQKDQHLTGMHDVIEASVILYDEGTQDRENGLLVTKDRIFRPCP